MFHYSQFSLVPLVVCSTVLGRLGFLIFGSVLVCMFSSSVFDFVVLLWLSFFSSSPGSSFVLIFGIDAVACAVSSGFLVISFLPLNGVVVYCIVCLFLVHIKRELFI